MVVLAVKPDMAPGLMVQFPDGNPFSTTLPVATAQVGCVIVPTVGAVGVGGCALIVTLVPDEIQPSEFLAVTMYEP